jgi:hypothetical protein
MCDARVCRNMSFFRPAGMGLRGTAKSEFGMHQRCDAIRAWEYVYMDVWMDRWMYGVYLYVYVRIYISVYQDLCMYILMFVCILSCVYLSERMRLLIDTSTNELLIAPDWESNMTLADVIDRTNDAEMCVFVCTYVPRACVWVWRMLA